MISKKAISLLRISVYVLGGVAGLFQLLAALLAFDPGAHYFLRGAVLPTLAWIFAILGALLAIALAFLDKEPLPERKRAAFLAPALFFAALIPALLASVDGSSVIADRLAIIAAVCLCISVFFCLLSCFLQDQKYRGTLALLGFAPVLALAALTLCFYFDKSIEMNAPLKIAPQTGFLFAMFLFLCELRRLIGRPVPRLLKGLRLALFPIASLGSCLILSLAFTGRFYRLDYLFVGLLLLSLQATLLFDLFPARKGE